MSPFAKVVGCRRLNFGNNAWCLILSSWIIFLFLLLFYVHSRRVLPNWITPSAPINWISRYSHFTWTYFVKGISATRTSDRLLDVWYEVTHVFWTLVAASILFPLCFRYLDRTSTIWPWGTPRYHWHWRPRMKRSTADFLIHETESWSWWSRSVVCYHVCMVFIVLELEQQVQDHNEVVSGTFVPSIPQIAKDLDSTGPIIR